MITDLERFSHILWLSRALQEIKFHLLVWCMMGFLWLVFIYLGHEDRIFIVPVMEHMCTHTGPHFILSSKPVRVGGGGVGGVE